MANIVKARFCPSPTGEMHLGNCRTALLNWLFARSKEGVFLLRIEDTDLKRSSVVYIEQLMNDLMWLGLKWDEGPHTEGQFGPYFQSQRQAIYQQYYDILLEKDLAYFCFCSEEALERKRRFQLAAGKPPRYAGTCQHLTQAQIQEKLAQGIKPTLRFRIPRGTTIFDDLVRGSQTFQNETIGDFIIRRADGTSPFMFCSSIDDSLMGVTHILRGEDHLTNTPRQIMILNALQLRVPSYGHINLIVGSDGSPLSKRHGSQSIDHLRKKGYLSRALLNYLARLGHHYENDSLMTTDSLVEHFSLESLSKSPSRFDMQQLNYWQKEAVQALPLEDAWQWLGFEIQTIVPEAKRTDFLTTVIPNVHFPSDAAMWANILFDEQPVTYEQDPLALLEPSKQKAVIALLKQAVLNDEDIILTLKEKLRLKGKALFAPVRLIFTGKMAGPELKPTLLLIPKVIKQQRIIAAEEYVKNLQ
jgi:glutamyl-tRNA synthetase